ncbi:dynein light intermediate chain-domain-containing protein [Pilobolus umbonatus]|nr:dynein light intermediate chain-domain-containing protein [Pilobolus umbonatus]
MSGLLSSVTPSQSVSTNSLLTGTQANISLPGKEDIWSSILQGVASSKMVPTKNILILGEPGVGKSTLIHYLKNDPGPQTPKTEHEDTDVDPFNVNMNKYTRNPNEENKKNDLALGYSFIDMKDEENEAMARLGIYQLGLSSPEFLPLLKFAIRADTLPDSCVLILLDWTRPYEFITTLQKWISVLHHLIAEINKEGTVSDSGTAWSKGKAVVDELREKLENFLQSYTEPYAGITVTASNSTSSILSAVPNINTPMTSSIAAADQVLLPLTSGSLTTNLGIPIHVVCCKSDAMNHLEQAYDYKDEQFDYIQQTLRCLCMKYGASLFYTSTLQPHTFHYLREYLLHRLLRNSNKSYPFQFRAQVIERDSVVVPAGWDTWGKIKALKEGFDCEILSEGFDMDMEAIRDHQQPGLAGASGMYEESIPNFELEAQPHYIPITTVCEDEQAFYDRHYETLQKAQYTSSRPTNGHDASRPGVVGPVRIPSATIEMPRDGVEKDRDNARKVSKEPHLEKIVTSKNATVSTTASNTLTALASPNSAASNLGQSPQAINGPSHEVLANFFQSLLSKKATSGVGSPTGLSSPGSALLNGGLTGQPNGRSEETSPYRRSTINRKDVTKELDRLRQYTASK